MDIVEFENVTRAYPKKVMALRGVTLALPEGTVCGLVGRNGAGKTTLLRMIPALLHPTEGVVRVFGLDPWESQEEVKKQTGYLSENEVLPNTVRIRDMTDLCASLYPNWDRRMAVELLARFGLDSDRKLGALSKGQKRQVGLLCAVCHKPRLLVLDEPAGGLDPVARREFLEVVINLLADAGSTVIFSSHILSDLERVAQRLVVLHEGLILLDRPVDELKENVCRVEVAGEKIPPGARDLLTGRKGCFHVVQKDGALKVTLQCAPDEATEFLKSLLPESPDIRAGNAVALSLEDIFIELTGDRP
jgi:ABC-2 type transport system ATP-binding protein